MDLFAGKIRAYDDLSLANFALAWYRYYSYWFERAENRFPLQEKYELTMTCGTPMPLISGRYHQLEA